MSLDTLRGDTRAIIDCDIDVLPPVARLIGHTDDCPFCDQHGLCRTGKRLADAVREVAGIDMVTDIAELHGFSVTAA